MKKEYQGYIIDLDGTMYRGADPIKEAPGFIERLRASGVPFLFLTNNSTGHPSDKVEQLRRVGVEAYPEEVYTSSLATADYLASLGGKTVYAIGEKGLLDALSDKGLIFDDQAPDYVVIGLDRQVTYEKLEKAVLLIQAGAQFFATNKDSNIPTERGMSPSNGALVAFVEKAVDVSPQFIGKPEAIIMEKALDKLGCTKSEVLMVGDNYETDIRSGLDNGIDTLLVLSGFTTKQDLEQVEKQPTYVVETLDEWEVE
ncbi:TIGR01457 family HAD-type hydrolase [Dolosigranulum savutiense]|uniref:TIGR01457 family HAD-type hydrolase n=1 Tax=Dolosigranulum savutiense TaxID=3110288 RepID=A0AB74TWF7_9LACT